MTMFGFLKRKSDQSKTEFETLALEHMDALYDPRPPSSAQRDSTRAEAGWKVYLSGTWPKR